MFHPYLPWQLRVASSRFREKVSEEVCWRRRASQREAWRWLSSETRRSEWRWSSRGDVLSWRRWSSCRYFESTFASSLTTLTATATRAEETTASKILMSMVTRMPLMTREAWGATLTSWGDHIRLRRQELQSRPRASLCLRRLRWLRRPFLHRAADWGTRNFRNRNPAECRDERRWSSSQKSRNLSRVGL